MSKEGVEDSTKDLKLGTCQKLPRLNGQEEMKSWRSDSEAQLPTTLKYYPLNN